VGAIRALGIAVGYDDLKSAPTLLQQMGQLIFAPPNVSGWDGDKDSTSWLGTGTWMARVNFINPLAAAATTSAAGTRQQLVGATAPMQQLLSAYRLASAEDVVAYLLAALVDNAVTDDRRAVLKTTLAQGGAGGPTLNLAGGGTIAAAGVRQALYLVMSMPEFQLN
jgi:hypothetical protein